MNNLEASGIIWAMSQEFTMREEQALQLAMEALESEELHQHHPNGCEACMKLLDRKERRKPC